MIRLEDLVKAGVHFGHQKSHRNPKMDPYIWGKKSGINLIDVSKTSERMAVAAEFLKGVAREGKQVLWVGTKKPAQEIMLSVATKLNLPYVNHRWVGGTLSNHSQVKKSVTKLLHFEDVLANAEQAMHYTKKELNVFQKMVDRLKQSIGGIRKLNWPIGAVVLVDVNKEVSALREAADMGVPVVALVDTNSDPSLVDYVIPANDDTPSSIKIIVDYLADAVAAGQSEAKSAGVEAVAAEPTVEKAAEAAEPSEDITEEDKAKKRAASAAPKRREPAGRRAPAKAKRPDSAGDAEGE